MLCSMGSRKQITFDLSQEALRQHYGYIKGLANKHQLLVDTEAAEAG